MARPTHVLKFQKRGCFSVNSYSMLSGGLVIKTGRVGWLARRTDEANSPLFIYSLIDFFILSCIFIVFFYFIILIFNILWFCSWPMWRYFLLEWRDMYTDAWILLECKQALLMPRKVFRKIVWYLCCWWERRNNFPILNFALSRVLSQESLDFSIFVSQCVHVEVRP